MSSSRHIMNDLKHLITKKKQVSNKQTKLTMFTVVVVHMCININKSILLFTDVHTVLGMV